MSTEVATIDKELDECAYQINFVGKQIAARLPELGMWCAQARDLLSKKRDGSFAAWVEENVEVSLGYCYGAIRVWERFGDCNGCKIDVRAMLLLSSPSIPEEARQQAIEESKSQQVTAKRAKEIVNEHRMEVVRDEPQSQEPDDDDGLDEYLDDEDGSELEPEPKVVERPKAKATSAKSLEPNVIGGAANQVITEFEFAIENLKDFEVAAVFERVGCWMAEQRERRGIKP